MRNLCRKWCCLATACALAMSAAATRAVEVQTLGGGPNQTSTARSGFKNGNTLSVAKFFNPFGIAADAEGNLYVADKGNNKVRKIVRPGAADSLTSTFASRLPSPVAVAVDVST